MMCSFLNVGINETIAEGFARQDDHQWAAWDSYRRFVQTWGMFQGLERNIFDEIMTSYKNRYEVKKKIQFNPEQMRLLALSYKEAMERRGIKIADDPYQQLQHAILEVFASWNSEQARIYRHQMHLSDEWGTAVIVQAMVFGNLNENSGSGVIMTRDPKGSSQDVSIYGDFIFGVQGDDIVSGSRGDLSHLGKAKDGGEKGVDDFAGNEISGNIQRTRQDSGITWSTIKDSAIRKSNLPLRMPPRRASIYSRPAIWFRGKRGW